MKCRYCRCTEDNACKGGCSWVAIMTAGHNRAGKQEPLALPVCTSCVPKEIQRKLLTMGKTTSCDRMRANACNRPAKALTLEKKGGRWYVIRSCSMHGTVRERVGA